MPDERHIPNYMVKLADLQRRGLLPVGVHRVTILHDGWCAIYGMPPGVCSCDPDIALPPDPRRN